MNRGMLITFEGGEGCGKSTQHKLFTQALQEREIALLQPSVREPGGTLIGERIREILLCNDHTMMGDVAELLLFEAARAQIVHEVIRPAILSGLTVVLDRYYDSTTAYQGYARGIDIGRIRWLNEYATQEIVPDITYLFDIEPAIGLQRATRKSKDRLEAESLDFHRLVRDGYLQIAENEPDRVVLLDGTRGIDQLQQDVMESYQARLVKE